MQQYSNAFAQRGFIERGFYLAMLKIMQYVRKKFAGR
jgi:hypothetical protein